MKKVLTIASLFIVMTAHAQTKVTKDANGNYVPVSQTDTASNKPTGKVFTDRSGKQYPVFISARGKLYYLRTSKRGIVYKAYIKEGN